MHREGLSAEDLRSWNALMQQGTELENARSYDEALKVYQGAEKIDDRYAELQFRMARSSWMLGDYAGAREHFQRSRHVLADREQDASGFWAYAARRGHSF